LRGFGIVGVGDFGAGQIAGELERVEACVGFGELVGERDEDGVAGVRLAS